MPRTMTGRYLSEVPLEAEAYKADLEVVDRYQAFSTELLRLALLGIAGYGFLLSQIIFGNTESAEFLTRLQRGQWLLALGLAALGVSAGAALMHRFYSTDCITHHIRFLRLHRTAQRLAPASSEREGREAQALSERRSLENDLELCKWSLLVSAVALCSGAVAVVATFGQTLFE